MPVYEGILSGRVRELVFLVGAHGMAPLTLQRFMRLQPHDVQSDTRKTEKRGHFRSSSVGEIGVLEERKHSWYLH